MDQEIAWATAESWAWVSVPIGQDGHEAELGKETSVAYVGWQVDGDERLVPAAMILRNLRVEPLTPAQWRLLKPAEAIAASREVIDFVGAVMSASHDEDERAGGSQIRQAVANHRPGTSRPDEFYAEVGAVYSEAVRKSDTQPVQAVRLHFKKKYSAFKDLKDSTVRGWVQIAKSKGFITKTARPRRSKQTGGS